MGVLIILAILAVFIVIFAVKGFVIIQQSETMVIERLGRYHRTLSSGVNIVWPLSTNPGWSRSALSRSTRAERKYTGSRADRESTFVKRSTTFQTRASSPGTTWSSS